MTIGGPNANIMGTRTNFENILSPKIPNPVENSLFTNRAGSDDELCKVVKVKEVASYRECG